MPKPYPTEFRRDVIAVARQGGSIALIAKDLGITESCLRNWLRQADIEDGNRPLVSPMLKPPRCVNSSVAIGSSSKRSRSCAEQRPTSPRTSPQNDIPAGR